MARIPQATRGSVPDDQRDAFDEFVGKHGDAITKGPMFVLINVPEMAKRGTHLSEYLRLQSSLTSKIRELAMLVTGRELDCQHIWNAHAARGRKDGLRDETVDNLRERKVLTGLPPDEEAVVNYGQEFFRTHQVSQPTFDAALAQFGVQGLTELTNLMGYYALLAFNINAFGVELHGEITEPELSI